MDICVRNETVTNCYQLKLPAADGKQRLTDMADLQGIFRIIQSIPSKKAEPVKQWLAQLGEQRIDQMIDPELTFQCFPSPSVTFCTKMS